MNDLGRTELSILIVLIGGLGATELVIVLIILLALLSVVRRDYLARGMSASMEEWQRQHRQPQKSQSRRFFVTGVLCRTSLIVITELESRDTISSAQALALIAVAVGWSIVGYHCIGKRSG